MYRVLYQVNAVTFSKTSKITLYLKTSSFNHNIFILFLLHYMMFIIYDCNLETYKRYQFR